MTRFCDNRKAMSSTNAIIAKDFICGVRDNVIAMKYSWIQKLIGNEYGAKAKLARHIGIGQDMLSKIFSGTREFTPKEILRVAQYFSISPEEVITGIRSSAVAANSNEDGFMAALKIIIGAIATKGNPGHNLDVLLTHQIRGFGQNNQSNVAQVLRELLNFLHFGLPQTTIPEDPQSLPLGQDQSKKEKNLKNRP